MAASLRFLHSGKKVPYLTALKAITRNATNSNERRPLFQHDRPPNQKFEEEQDGLQAKFILQAIGYEDKRQPSGKPKPSHPGEYVTAWGDFRPKPSSTGQPKPPTQKPTSSVASLLPLGPQDWSDIDSTSCHDESALATLLTARPMNDLHAAVLRAVASHVYGEVPISMLAGMSLGPASLAESEVEQSESTT